MSYQVFDVSMADMTSILSAYERAEPHRALGGIHALAGFDYQLRFFLAELVESLAAGGAMLDEVGRVFLEALSDVARQAANQTLVCIQVKRTLTRKAVADAAAEVETIQRFLTTHHPQMSAQVTFRLVASQGDASLQWTDVPAAHPARPTIDALLRQGRLLPPAIEADPWWRAVVAVWTHLKDPYGFLRFALERALSRDPLPADAQRIRDDICERFAAERRVHELPGQLLTPADFQRNAVPSRSLEIGREITLARLRDQQYMPRSHRLNALYATLLERQDLSLRDLRSEARVFWLSGRSGVGKSVLLLQTVERLVGEGWKVLWLKGQAELLEPALRAIADAPAQWRPDFIAIDDLYDRSARTRLDLGRLGEFIDERGHQTWPMILTCGPTEFADAFKEDSAYRGFDLHRQTIQTIAADEAAEVEAWYRERTGRASRRGPAVSQASQDDGGLFISVAVELAHGDLNAFARRFGERVQLNGLDEALRLPLALNRLYLSTPYDWLSESDREKLATLNGEGDFSLFEMGSEGQTVRLTHPHLADALYQALRKPSNKLAYTNDLVTAFQRVLAARDAGLVSQLLRLFSVNEEGLISERLSIVERGQLARECAKAWCGNQMVLDEDGQADVSVSWACWATTAPDIVSVLGEDLLETALAQLGQAYKVWPGAWGRLISCYPGHDELFAWAREHLGKSTQITHPAWSFVWEDCLRFDPRHETVWRNMAFSWLQHHLRRPDWHIVWKKLLLDGTEPDWKADPVLLLGMRRVRAEQDGPDWAYVLQDLYALAEPCSPQVEDLAILASGWLAGHENRAEWSYVWRSLLMRPDVLPGAVSAAQLLLRGMEWLAGREDRAEWVHVWRFLLAQADELSLAELLSRGVSWLEGREDRAEWAHVWQELLKYAGPKADAVPFAQLLHRGVTWLVGREDQPEWSYVWRGLLGSAEVLPDVVPMAELLRCGFACLAGREDRAEWSYIWQPLLVYAEELPDVVPIAELISRGVSWLAGREDRVEWSIVWQKLLKYADARSDKLMLAELLPLAVAWLPGREHRTEWAHIWQDLLQYADANPDAVPLTELLQLGAAWLVGRDLAEAWSFVCEALLDRRFQSADLFDRTASWLKLTDTRPEWPVLAAKFIVAAPYHAASADFACALERRITALPNNKHWRRTQALIGDLTSDSELPEAVQSWWRAVHERRNSSAWTTARRCLDEGLPINGQVTVVKETVCSVELEIGLMAVWANENDRARGTKGLKLTFFVQTLNVDSEVVQVGLEKPVRLVPGEVHEGRVVERRDFGLRVSVGGQAGLLHRSKCRDWPSLAVKYPVGSTISVEILELTERGPALRYAGVENDSAAVDLVVGGIYQGHVAGVQHYGVFLTIGSHLGLLHRSELPGDTEPSACYVQDQVLRVQVKKIRDDGRLSLSLPGQTDEP
ncbi:S1 RNA-binding domain-containing protein [Pseudomonas japonica]|uniref:S1 RNA-binding domain-containing protein n=1 Tax=Pseudomonas japonica TaxID=256466 RepID=UPI0038284FA9